MRRLASVLGVVLSCVLVVGLVPGRAEAATAQVVVGFDGSGAKPTAASKKVTPGKNYGTLPKAWRSGYYLAGWYTEASGGRRITASTKVSATTNHTLFARWRTAVHYVFNTNGGTMKEKVRDVKPGNDIDWLPTPTRSSYSFMGWYTNQKHGGKRITTSTNAPKTPQEITLYARWAPKPLFQFDPRWKSLRYVSTVRGSGCGLTAMAIAVRAVSGKNVTPKDARRYALAHDYDIRKPGRTKAGFFTNWPATYGIKITPTNDKDKALQAVKDGNWVVAFMKPGRWTREGHFIVWYDLTGSTALIRDPNARKASKVRAPYKTLQSQTWTGVSGNKHHRFYIVEVPDSRKLYQVG